MAGKNKIALRIAYRKNNNMKSTAYSKYFPEVALRQKMDFQSFIDHVTAHGLGYPREIIEAVTTQLMQCLPELVLQGISVKIDGLGHFYPSVTSLRGKNDKKGFTEAEVLAGVDFSDIVEGLHMRFLPQSDEDNSLTSTTLKKTASIETVGIYAKASITAGTEQDPETVETDKDIIIPLEELKKAAQAGS